MAEIRSEKQLGKCPFNKMKPCTSECALYRKTIRYRDNDPDHPYVVELCALNAIADAMDNNIMRLLGVQKEVNVLRNQVTQTVQNLIRIGQARNAIEREIENRVVKRLVEQHKEDVINIEEGESVDGEVEAPDNGDEELLKGTTPGDSTEGVSA